MTEAQEFIRARTKSQGPDSVRELWGLVEPEIPSWAKNMLTTGKLAIGKLHEPGPRALTELEDDGSIAVGISAGFFDCIYAFARPIGAQQTVHGATGRVAPSIERPAVIAELRRLFELFAAGGHVFHGGYPIHPEQRAIADELATFAELSVLAHELGHVAALAGQGPEGEANADRFAARLLLAVGARVGYRMPLAGAFFSFRVFGLLERFGIDFGHTHPPSTDRTALFVEEAIKQFGSRAQAYKNLSITVAFDEFIESFENEALGQGTMTTQTPLRVSVRLRAILEEASRGRLPLHRLVEELGYGFHGVSAALLTQAVLEYCEDVASGAVSHGSGGVAALVATRAGLAEPHRSTVESALKSAGVLP